MKMEEEKQGEKEEVPAITLDGYFDKNKIDEK